MAVQGFRSHGKLTTNAAIRNCNGKAAGSIHRIEKKMHEHQLPTEQLVLNHPWLSVLSGATYLCHLLRQRGRLCHRTLKI